MSRFIALGVLALAVFASALAVVLARHESRKAFVELQQIEAERDAMQEEWGRLQLEQATWGTHGRVEELARAELQMTQPAPDKIVLVAP